jgi:predicted ATPase
MAQHPFLKSIRPVNLLSFGPNTEEIELRPLNILIGPNGSGKTNLIEVLGMLKELPDRDPWSSVIRSGVDEWFWKGGKLKTSNASVDVVVCLDEERRDVYSYSLQLAKQRSLLSVWEESINPVLLQGSQNGVRKSLVRSAYNAQILGPSDIKAVQGPNIEAERSIFSQLNAVASALADPNSPNLYGVGEFFARMAFYRDWEFGVGSAARDPQSASERTTYLEEDQRNLAHMLNALRTGDNFGLRDKFKELLTKFYEDAEDIEIELTGGRISMRLLERNGISTPAVRLSDGTLRWLALLVILLNPTPAPVTCIEEPELGLHPDAIHTLADLLVEASTRTQLIVTTHSDALLDAFTDTPDVVCVCEKVEGSTVIRRLEKERLKVWLKDYSLGHLWMSGEIGGNRW